MDRETVERLLGGAKEIARRAGQAILEVSVNAAAIEAKEDGSPLTCADMTSHEVIESGLRELRPMLPMISEEGDLTEADVGSSRTYWLVDPLDGTKEFIKGLGEYTVNIAVVEESTPILGVIHVPATDVLYYAAEGCGAWKMTPRGVPLRMVANDCHGPARAVVSRSHMSAGTEQFLARLGVTDVIRCGSSLKICAVAEGTADLYPRFGATWLWDTAAGVAIAEEAGCVVVGPGGASLSYDPAVTMKHSGFIVHRGKMRLPDDSGPPPSIGPCANG